MRQIWMVEGEAAWHNINQQAKEVDVPGFLSEGTDRMVTLPFLLGALASLLIYRTEWPGISTFPYTRFFTGQVLLDCPLGEFSICSSRVHDHFPSSYITDFPGKDCPFKCPPFPLATEVSPLVSLSLFSTVLPSDFFSPKIPVLQKTLDPWRGHWSN